MGHSRPGYRLGVCLRLIAVCLSVLLTACNCATARASSRLDSPYALDPAGSSTEPAGLLIPIGDFDADEILPALQKFDERAEAGDRLIYFRINSFGGSVFLGLDAIAHIGDVKRAKNIKTVCIVDNRAMSMGAAFLESDACDVRLMTTRSTLLFHNASGGAEGTAEQLHEGAEILDALNEALANVCAGRMLISVDEYRAMIAGHAWTMAVSEAVAVGAVDGTIEPGDMPAAYELQYPQMQLFEL